MSQEQAKPQVRVRCSVPTLERSARLRSTPVALDGVGVVIQGPGGRRGQAGSPAAAVDRALVGQTFRRCLAAGRELRHRDPLRPAPGPQEDVLLLETGESQPLAAAATRIRRWARRRPLLRLSTIAFLGLLLLCSRQRGAAPQGAG